MSWMGPPGPDPRRKPYQSDQTYDPLHIAGSIASGVNGSGLVGDRPAIGGHGDINNPVTWWALHCLTAAP